MNKNTGLQMGILIIENDYSGQKYIKGNKNGKNNDGNYPRECWTIDGKKICAWLAADEPTEDNLEVLPELTKEMP